MTVGTVPASVFDAYLPTLAYDDAELPQRCIPASRRHNGWPRSHWDRTDPKCFRISSSVPVFVILGSRSHPA